MTEILETQRDITASDALDLQHDYQTGYVFTVNSLGERHRSKIFNDPIHGHMELSRLCTKIIDTPQFQRLRDLKQLGTTYFLFPGASHNRFEHCLGVSHLAGKWVEALQTRKQYEKEDVSGYKIRDPEERRQVKLVSVAGLCHDLGHGPFSHCFEDWAEQVSGGSWHHEDMSLKLLEYTINENAIDMSTGDVNTVCSLIKGQYNGSVPKYLYDVVANHRNSVDVDKWDYLQRDCYNLGLKYSYDATRLMTFSQVIGDEICFHAKEVFNIYELFHTRYSLFKQIYTHRVGKALEYMIIDALNLANPVLEISNDIHDPERFYLLTDSILNRIESSNDKGLQASRDLLKRLRRRDLYRLADEVLIPADKWDIFKNLDVEDMKREITSIGNTLGGNLSESDIIINRLRLNYALDDRNPVDAVHFYSRHTLPNSSSGSRSPRCFSIPKSQVSLLIPSQFSEHYLRVYSRNSDPTVCRRIQKSFREYLRRFPQLRLEWNVANLIPSPNGANSLNSSTDSAYFDGFKTPPRPTTPLGSMSYKFGDV